MRKNVLVLCTTDSMIYNFLIPHIKDLQSNNYNVICACSKTGDFFYILKENGFEMYQIDFERNPYDLKNAKAYIKLNRLVKEKQIDIIFCHEPVGGAMGRIVGHRNGCKVIYMAHGFHFYKGAPKKARIYYHIEKFLSRYTDALITINQEDYEVSKTFYAKKVFKLNGIGIDTSKFICSPDSNYLRKELNLSEDIVLLLSVGELIDRKNHITMILAMKFLPPNYHYVIVGDGELEKRINEMIIKENLNERVHLLGYRRDILKICNSSDVYIMPSIQEGVSVALMEAMACELPVVASKIRGNIDLIDEGKGGYLVEATDFKKYAKAIKKIIEKNEKNKFGKYNREKVRLFDLNTVREQLHELWEETK